MRIVGVVKWFNSERGYGFCVDPNDEEKEYFVHFSNIAMEGYKALKTGQNITFELKDTEKGVQAVDVEII